MTYNGWTNYETWCVALHFDNDQGTYSLIREWIDELKDPDVWPEGADLSPESEDHLRDLRLEIADRLKQLADDLTGRDDSFDVPTPDPLALDLIGAALAEVDWHEIAAHILSE